MSPVPDNSGEPNFFAYLVTVPAVTDLVAHRIYHNRAPEGARDTYAVWQRPGGQRQPMFCGTDDTVGGEYQVDIYSYDDVKCLNAARAIRDALIDHAGPMGSVNVKKILLTNDFDSVDPDPGLNRRTQFYTVWYAEG